MYAAPPICHLLVIRSRDIDRAVKFDQTMGLLFSKHSHGNGPEHSTSEAFGFVFEIYPARDDSDSTAATRFGLHVDNVDSVVEMLLEIGAKLRTKVEDTEWGRRAVVHDFDGHIVELITPINRQSKVADEYNLRNPDGG